MNLTFNQFIMENFTKFLKWLKTLPLWMRAVILALLAALSFFVSMGFTSCGTTRAVVHNGASGTSTEIKITTNNPTSVTASPSVELKYPNKPYD